MVVIILTARERVLLLVVVTKNKLNNIYNRSVTRKHKDRHNHTRK